MKDFLYIGLIIYLFFSAYWAPCVFHEKDLFTTTFVLLLVSTGAFMQLGYVIYVYIHVVVDIKLYDIQDSKHHFALASVSMLCFQSFIMDLFIWNELSIQLCGGCQDNKNKKKSQRYSKVPSGLNNDF
jgi:hypothetical protein